MTMFEKIKNACPNVVDDDFVPAIVGGSEKIVIVKTDDNKFIHDFFHYYHTDASLLKMQLRPILQDLLQE